MGITGKGKTGMKTVKDKLPDSMGTGAKWATRPPKIGRNHLRDAMGLG